METGAAIVEEEAFDQLLGEGAASLFHSSGAYVRPERSDNALQIETGMRIKAAVLDHFQCIGQQQRGILRGHDQSVFAVACEETSDLGWFEANQRNPGIALIVQ